ncbi:DUF6285 domain-containing protein [Cupriavidus taiwanensis]|uniref:DUF6285 domain-containing protein n=1 Tax=Cupriavidus taiwanensis TaxID=164546 RepID=A0A375GRZ4_9BURK|nr:DUF6285 domain-containing protein [Cupriavidus taiwanensis]SOY53963.1 conserved hypothetical protein [Cupriavidus taiwanensis]SOY54434.1 conserved hypothetical protein [Cupriavidus taiwanensis]SOY87648.1 conserved hypothetical protein [Cupriavidus taiwanensis]SOZ24093.1 conserved hypothetical protein [Cupriavidus taiwanensis]SOZ58768.1 conserved hypothetical protein [Cupriavidus taiwanensis]
MQDTPHAAELIDAVTAFLRGTAIPNLSGRAAFDARVAANVLDIVARELRLAPAAQADEHERLRALLGTDGTLAELNQRLCEAIAGGRIDTATPGLGGHLWAVTLAKLAVDQPGYSSYRQIIDPEETLP